MANFVATDEPSTANAAGRYASALYELSLEQGKLQETEQNLTSFSSMLADSADLKHLVRSPTFTVGEQLQALGAVLDKAQIGGLAGNFLRLITRNRRLFAAQEMIQNFRTLAARGRGEAQAEVTSAIALTDTQTTLLKETLKGSIGKDVQLTAKVDPSLLGGLVVKLGSRMIDSSISTKLSNLKLAMKEAR